MPLVRTALIATAACLIGAAAYAQPGATPSSETPQSQSVPQTAPDNNASTGGAGMSADQSGGAMGASGDMGAQTGMAANTSTTVGANGNQVIASQPVPDTPANRAAYGKPLSRAGKRTAPAGN
ncbi:MAG TPA: hypothetical protein VFE13_07245 [Caulobacteraceae bacterium]|jgi:hypothetical protein|nr:hypothetical protein [Caulobacteraceae bacterium]